MPVVRSIYSAIKQIMETVMSTNSNSLECCSCSISRKLWVIGFVTGSTKEKSKELSQRKNLINVFIPTTNQQVDFYYLFPKI